MTRRIAGLPVWGPADVLDGMRAVLGWTDEALAMAGALPGRVAALLDETEALVVRMTALADRVDGVLGRTDAVMAAVEATVARAGGVSDAATVVVGQAGAVAARAGEVVAQAGDTSGAARDMLATYAPIAEQAAPLARRFVAEFSAEELHAMIRLVDQMPALTVHVENDIMPILATLDRVGPDVHELLDVLKDVRQAINGIPGFAYLRRRGELGEEG